MPKKIRSTKHAMPGKSLYEKARNRTKNRQLYDGKWRRLRFNFLKDNPICLRCQEEGRITPATVVDHIIPHRGSEVLFYDETNWQPLCKRCHDKKTATEDGGLGRDNR